MAPKTKTPDRLTVEERRELPASAFGIPETREFPLVDAAHIRAAEAYFRYASDDQKPELARNILEKAAEYGVRVESPVVLSWAGKWLLYNDLTFCVAEYCVNVGAES